MIPDRHPKLVLPREVDPSWPIEGFTLDGHRVLLESAARVMTAEALSNVYFLDAKGMKVFPWRDAGYYVSGDGEVLAPTVPEDEAEMTREHLESLGSSDRQLAREFSEAFPERREEVKALDPHGDSRALRALRYELFWDLMGHLYD